MNEQRNPDDWLRASVVFGRPRRLVDRHLVIVHQQGWQAIEDWQAIADRVRRLDSRIEVFIVEADMPNSVTRRRAAELPTLVVSPGPLGRFRPLRGKVYHGRIIPKFEQLRRLAAAGVSVPNTAILTPDLKLDPRLWGEYVVLKPTDILSSSKGYGIVLMRTDQVRYVPPALYPPDHPGRLAPMVVQQYVDTGERVSHFRVLTWFGEPLYCKRTEADQAHAPLEQAAVAADGLPIASANFESRTVTYIYRADIVALARAAYNAIPEVPLQGCDVIEDVRTGRLFVLELNPGGNTWHFSSGFWSEKVASGAARAEPERHSQLDAFGTVAVKLVEKVRAEAA